MSNIGAFLREEITRLSRKEVRSQVDPTRKFTAQHRRDIAALKRQIAQLERQVKQLSRNVLGARTTAVSGSPAKPTRFSAKGLHSNRNRLGLSAIEFGKLVGVSAQTIYNWEQETTRPRAEQLDKLATLRGLGKRDVGERLQRMQDANGKQPRKS